MTQSAARCADNSFFVARSLDGGLVAAERLRRHDVQREGDVDSASRMWLSSGLCGQSLPQPQHVVTSPNTLRAPLRSFFKRSDSPSRCLVQPDRATSRGPPGSSRRGAAATGLCARHDCVTTWRGVRIPSICLDHDDSCSRPQELKVGVITAVCLSHKRQQRRQQRHSRHGGEGRGTHGDADDVADDLDPLDVALGDAEDGRDLESASARALPRKLP